LLSSCALNINTKVEEIRKQTWCGNFRVFVCLVRSEKVGPVIAYSGIVVILNVNLCAARKTPNIYVSTILYAYKLYTYFEFGVLVGQRIRNGMSRPAIALLASAGYATVTPLARIAPRNTALVNFIMWARFTNRLS